VASIKDKVPDFTFEYECLIKGYNFIAGVDEVGRGAWAGPVYVGAAIMPYYIDGIYDSKLLNAKNREIMADKIKQEAIAWATASANLDEINKLGIHQATFLAFRRVVEALEDVDFVLSDAFTIPGLKVEQQAITKGDMQSVSIAAASIIAKVERDNLMGELGKKYPEYFFDSHKGYGTKFHQECLAKHGPCEIHRKGFKPIAKYLNC